MLDKPSVGARGRVLKLVGQILAKNGVSGPVSTGDALTDIGLSSIDMVNLMLAVEAEFDVTIPESEITPENFQSVAALEQMILHQLQPEIA